MVSKSCSAQLLAVDESFGNELRGPPVACALTDTMLALSGFGRRDALRVSGAQPLLKDTPRVGAAPPEA